MTVTAAMLLLVRTVVEAPDERLGLGADGRRLRRWRPRCWRRSSRSSGAAAHPLVRLGILRSAPLVRANLGAMALFGCLLRLPVRRHAVPADDARLAALETALAFLPGRACSSRSASPRIGPLVDRFGTAAADRRRRSRRCVAGYVLFLRLGDNAVLRRR